MKEIIKISIDEVSNSFPSIYSKQDVVDILVSLNEMLQSEEVPSFDYEKFKEAFVDEFETEMNRVGTDKFVVHETAEFSISYNNQLELDHVDVNIDKIREIADELLDRMNPGIPLEETV